MIVSVSMALTFGSATVAPWKGRTAAPFADAWSWLVLVIVEAVAETVSVTETEAWPASR